MNEQLKPGRTFRLTPTPITDEAKQQAEGAILGMAVDDEGLPWKKLRCGSDWCSQSHSPHCYNCGAAGVTVSRSFDTNEWYWVRNNAHIICAGCVRCEATP